MVRVTILGYDMRFLPDSSIEPPTAGTPEARSVVFEPAEATETHQTIQGKCFAIICWDSIETETRHSWSASAPSRESRLMMSQYLLEMVQKHSASTLNP